jgi:aspartate/methionine/tyrosine aminotransferase
MKLPRQLAKRGDIDPFIVMDMMRIANEREAAGADIIHMEVGQPATPAPAKVIEAAREALGAELLGYTDALGLPALREAIAQHYLQKYGVAVAPERIVVTTGSSAGFVLAFLAILDEGARVALPSPGYPAYRHILRALGNEPVLIETGAEGRWILTGEHLRNEAAGDGLQATLMASPANPTGTMLTNDALQQLIAVCDSLGLWFISDEIYHGLDFAQPAQTALAHSDAAIVVNSFSKYFSMTGWRIGWMVVPPGLVRTIERLAQNLYISPPTLSQHAAIAAFDSVDELEGIKAVYARNRELLLDGLPGAGLGELLPADGAFYLYSDVRQFTNDSVEFAQRMLNEAGVAVTPGVDFDVHNGAHYVRFCYAGQTERMAEAIRRITSWLN